MTGDRRTSGSDLRSGDSLDLGVLTAFVVLTDVLILVPILRDGWVRVALAVPFVLFTPGYALVSALFPRDSRVDDQTPEVDGDLDLAPRYSRRGIDAVERIALAFVGSIVFVILGGVVLYAFPWQFGLVPVVTLLSGLSVGLAVVGHYRRSAVPPAEQFAVPIRRWGREARAGLTAESRVDLLLNVAIVATVLLAAGSVVYADTTSDDDFTEFYVMAQNDEGEFVVGSYPDTVARGSTVPFRVGIANHEDEAVNYTLVATLDQMRRTDTDATVAESRQLARRSLRVTAGESARVPVTVSPSITGERLRLSFLLYRGTVPSEPTPESAYRETHLWITVPGA